MLCHALYGELQASELTEFFLSSTSQLSGVNAVSLFTLFLAFPSSSAVTLRVGSIWRIAVRSTLIHIWRPEIADGRDLPCINMTGGIFTSKKVILCLLFFFLRNSYAALHISCTHLHPNEEERRIPFSLSPLWDLVSVDLFDPGLSEQYKVIPHGGFDWPRFRR